MNKEYKIYKLLDPENLEIRYIGVTTKMLNERLSQHLYVAKTKKTQTRVSKWIRSLFKRDLKPLIELVEISYENNWQEREKYWIEFYKNLTNTSPGGAGLVLDRNKASIDRSAEGHKIPIVQLDKFYNLIKRWESTQEATDFLGFKSTSSVNNALRGRSNYAKGFIFIYEKDYLSNNFMKEKRREHITKVYQYDIYGNFIQEWQSVVEVSHKIKEVKYSSSIFEAAKRKGSSGGYYWSFNFLDNMKSFIRTKEIVRLSDEKIFYSYKEIALEYNISYDISSGFRAKKKSKSGNIFWKNSLWEIKNCKDIV